MICGQTRLANTSIIGSVPETKGDESLDDTDESVDTYLCIMMGEDSSIC